MFDINSSIEKASTLPPVFYQSPDIWEACKEKIFCKNWLFLGGRQEFFKGNENVCPLWLLENYLDEPLLLIKNGDSINGYTNVCTHRGFLLVQHPGQMQKIVCKYHGRRFDLKGRFEFMPEFDNVNEFPGPCDHLHELPVKSWRQFLFTTIDSVVDFRVIAAQLEERLSVLPVISFRFAPEYSKIYNVHAHWALYCDNYLEGFHIPFVHKGLNQILDYAQYTTECYDQMVLQIGFSSGKDHVLQLPDGHPDFGKGVTAYYYWIFPNLMLNFYPWGLQLNVVRPVTPGFTKVEFLYYIHDENLFRIMEGSKLADKTEREDEFVVEAVQKGIRSRFYRSGRFSPAKEKGVHYFHRLVAESLEK